MFAGETTERLAEKFADKEFVAICNHCESPVCVRVCPTKATFKNDQGIVLMDMHRCIGCRNCMAACPYGARSFNFVNPRDYIDEINPSYPTRMKGVVEKCNFWRRKSGYRSITFVRRGFRRSDRFRRFE